MESLSHQKSTSNLVTAPLQKKILKASGQKKEVNYSKETLAKISEFSKSLEKELKSFSQIVDLAIEENNKCLWQIDPGLTGESRWGNSLIPNIFAFIANVFSAWYHEDEVKLLQATNKTLTQHRRLPKSFCEVHAWAEGVTHALKVSNQDTGCVSKITELNGSWKIAKKQNITFAGEVRLPERDIKTYKLSDTERNDKKKISRESGQQRKINREMRIRGRLNHDPLCGTYGNNNNRDYIQESKINFKLMGRRKPRPKKDLAVINAAWNAG